MTQAYEWRGHVGDVWAEEWRRTDRSLAPVNGALAAEAATQATGFDRPRILDVGCGAGATSLALADAIAGAQITGVDLSAPLIAVARRRAEGRDNVRFEVGDAARWTPASGRFDLVVSRHGIMFFTDPVAAFSHMNELAGADARLVFSCFRDRSENQWVAALDPIIGRFAPDALAAPAPAAGPFAFGDRLRIEAILSDAGFVSPGIRPFDFDFVAGSGDDPVAEAVSYFRRIGPFAAMLRELDEGDRKAALAELAQIAAAHRADSRIVFRASAWIVTAKVEKS